MNSIQLLNSHLDEIMLGGKVYPRAKVERVYSKLSTPKTTGTFYDANRVRGHITPQGEVSFQTYYPELANDFENGWSYYSPEEEGIKQTSPKPVRGLIGMQKAFQSHLRNPDGSVRSGGAGLYYNAPVSQHRSQAYENQGMVTIPGGNQFLDNRRFQNNPTIAELVMRMDAEQYPNHVAEVLRQPILKRHPQLQKTLETVHLPAAKLKGTAVSSGDVLENFDDANWIDQRILEIENSLPYSRNDWDDTHHELYREYVRLQNM